MTRLVSTLFSVSIFLSAIGVPCAFARAEAHPEARPETHPEARPTETIVFVGDSITQGYGVKITEAYPAMVEHILNMRGYSVKAINGGISGSTTADADQRVKWYLRGHPSIIVLALGENDALKGGPVAQIKQNLERAIDLAQKSGVKVFLVGSDIFANFGAEYERSLKKTFADLAKEKRVPFMPFLLEDVALHKDLMQADGKHPNARGQVLVAKNVAKLLEPLLPAPSKPTLDMKHEARE